MYRISSTNDTSFFCGRAHRAIHEKSKGQHRYGDTVYKLYHMPWQEQGDGMNYNITFIKLGSENDYKTDGGWENYRKRPYPQNDAWQNQ